MRALVFVALLANSVITQAGELKKGEMFSKDCRIPERQNLPPPGLFKINDLILVFQETK